MYYNLLNLPDSIPSLNLKYVYDATGRKLRKISGSTVTEYINGIQYTGSNIDFVQNEEGRVLNLTGTPNYEYTLTDNLGNNRLTFDSSHGGSTAMQSDEYYPFGLEANKAINGTKNKYLYNRKELQEELGMYDYGARFYDPVISRWMTVDPLAEKMRKYSPYNYAFDDPMRFIDPDGMKPTVKEAAAIANDVYLEEGAKVLRGGWHRSTAESNIKYNDSGNGLNSALYERTNKKTGKTEYVYATAGTNPLDPKDLAADALQLVGKSGQYVEAIANGRQISSDLKGKELTFVGHSLGGGEAAGNALATGRDAITFNAAGLSDATKINLQLNKSAKIDNYDVAGQAIKAQQVLGINPEGQQHPIGSPRFSLGASMTTVGTLVESLMRHLMGEVQKDLK